MKQPLLRTAVTSLWFNRKDAFYQVIIVAILAAIICGSLLTGDSVRRSLAKSLSEKLGNSDLLISSGTRYFRASVSKRISDKTGSEAVAILENDGFCRNFATGKTALHIKIYGIENDFFYFHHLDMNAPPAGEVFINEQLSRTIGAGEGDEIIVNFTEVDPIPSNAPFAPSGGNENSKVLKISKVLTGSLGGNFSLGASQLIPLNIFTNTIDLESSEKDEKKANRLLIHNSSGRSDSSFIKTLEAILTPSDIGLSMRISAKTGEAELLSDRIFIDNELAGEIARNTPGARPVITYLANSITSSGKKTPYSFISALPPDMSGVKGKDEILINKWLADDLDAKPGDSLKITWFDPGMGKRLEEKIMKFVISNIAGSNYIYSDPSLMPDFPGISGSTTCSVWDAGVPILLDNIRDKDEKYWNLYRGTPKAFINYETGKLLWGNNFGSATAFRYCKGADTSFIVNKLTGHINPLKAGFSLINLRAKNSDAAMNGVDFSTLFISLSLFVILSCIILLSISLSLFLNSRKDHVRTYNSVGFKRKAIFLIISSEALFVVLTGAAAGIILGCLVNFLMIAGLNSVWKGAVQIDTLKAGVSSIPLITGFLVTLIISAIIIFFKLRKYFEDLAVGSRNIHKPAPVKNINISLIILYSLSAILFLITLVFTGKEILFSFTAGAFFFAGMITTLLRFYSVRPASVRGEKQDYSRLYYSINPSHAITPAIFLAAGIFAVIITGANRQVVTEKMYLPPGGTGGFLIWAEAAIPVRYNLEEQAGRKEYGFDEPELKDLRFVTANRVSGDDASCLNISHVTAPPILGLDPQEFIEKGSFSFASAIKNAKGRNPWELLSDDAGINIIYGIADQTVLEWGLKIKTGDTLKYATENGEILNIVIAGGIKSSVFQGYVMIGSDNFNKYFPSVGGSSILLADGQKEKLDFYLNTISERLSGSGIEAEPAIQKLASFFTVTNTYLQVFTLLGALGLILGAAGLGFILKRNFNSRKHEFALMLATGYTTRKIKKLLLKDQLIILFWGLITGTLSALLSTLPSLKQGSQMPWLLIFIMLITMIITGITALIMSINRMDNESLVPLLRKE